MKLGRFLLMLGGLAALAVVCLAVVHFLVMPLIVHRHDVVRAPQLLGSTVSEARETAAAVGLDIEIVRRDAHPSQPAGTVIDQQPVPGLAMRQGRRIALVTSSGPAAGAVPALAGLSPRQAGATLQREDYRLGRALHVRLPDRAAEVVMCQSPPAGTHLRKGRQVDMVVAEPAARPSFLMPDLRGLSLYVAREGVADAGCVTSPVRFRRESGMAPNTVLEQRPSPGTRIRRGETIELVASTR